MSLRIEAVPEPASATEAPSWQLLGAARVENAVDVEIYGNDDLCDTAEQMSASLANQTDNRKVRLVAFDGDPSEKGDPDAVLGEASIRMPMRDNVTSANIYVAVESANRGHGIGLALWEAAAAIARDNGRTVLQAWTNHAVEPSEDDPAALAAPTGSGRIPGDDPGVRFALARGFQLEQAERHSVLGLPVDAALLQRLRDRSQAVAGEDYELVSWSDRVPDEWVESFCVLQTSMSTDAPLAGLTYEAEVWTPDRVRTMEKARADAQMHAVTVAALHRATGELAGYTEIAFADDRPHVGFQEITVVRADHRGHRLGILVKAANLQRLAAERPQVERIHTWNAEENDYMLSINVALGFYPAGGSAAWEMKPV